MTIRNHRNTDYYTFIPDPGAVVCRYCPAPIEICDGAERPAAEIRRLPAPPVCPLYFLLWRLRHVKPAEAFKLGDLVARDTLAKGLPARLFYRRIEILADRHDFVANVPNLRGQVAMPDALPLEAG